MSLPLEEFIVFALLLLVVVGGYYALKLHYVFAFGLVKKTSISEEKKQKIEKIKIYVFTFLKVLLWSGLLGMSIFGFNTLNEGISLKATVLQWWSLIPEGFWLYALWTIVRIALLIIVMKYILKKIYLFLDRQQQKTINKKVYNEVNIKKVYLRLHNTIKYTVVLGIMYRITHFFPFLEEVSAVMLVFVIMFFVTAVLITLREVWLMSKHKINY